MLCSLPQGSIPEAFVLAVVEQATAMAAKEVPTEAVEPYHPLATVTPEVGP